LTKMVWATFWATFFINSSGHPACHDNVRAKHICSRLSNEKTKKTLFSNKKLVIQNSDKILVSLCSVISLMLILNSYGLCQKPEVTYDYYVSNYRKAV
jgi:hypothetical protein